MEILSDSEKWLAENIRSYPDGSDAREVAEQEHKLLSQLRDMVQQAGWSKGRQKAEREGRRMVQLALALPFVEDTGPSGPAGPCCADIGPSGLPVDQDTSEQMVIPFSENPTPEGQGSPHGGCWYCDNMLDDYCPETVDALFWEGIRE